MFTKICERNGEKISEKDLESVVQTNALVGIKDSSFIPLKLTSKFEGARLTGQRFGEYR